MYGGGGAIDGKVKLGLNIRVYKSVLTKTREGMLHNERVPSMDS